MYDIVTKGDSVTQYVDCGEYGQFLTLCCATCQHSEKSTVTEYYGCQHDRTALYLSSHYCPKWKLRL